MRLSIFLLAASLSLLVQASWFTSSSGDPAYNSWNSNELRAWLEVHNIPLPKHTPSITDLRELVAENWGTASAWSYDQYTSAQKSFSGLKDTVFDSWSESQLREFLLEHGLVSPQGPREHLVLLAKQKYWSYNNAASSFASQASASASTALYGDSKQQISKSLSSLASHATNVVVHATENVADQLDYTKDYIYSTWSDNELRTWLEDKGVIKTKSQLHRDELLNKMHDAYAKVVDPIWQAWSTSYMHKWLVEHNIIKSDYEKNRDALVKQMNKYYYTATDTVYSSWTDSQLKKWLVSHGIMKSDADASRDKMLRMVQDNYLSAKDTFWSAWNDHSLRGWLIENGHMRSDSQVKRDELIKMANDKYTDQVSRTQSYLTWTDARLRAFLRQHGVDDFKLPGTRPGLLQETRIRWIQTNSLAETLIAKIKEIVNSGIYRAEDVLSHLYTLLASSWDETKRSAEKRFEHQSSQWKQGADETKKKWDGTKQSAGEKREKAKKWAGENADEVRENVGEKIKVAGQKVKGEL